MLDGFLKILGLGGGAAASPGIVPPKHMAQWAQAQGWHYAADGAAGGYSLQGNWLGQRWRLASGAPTRDYIAGTELHISAELPIAPSACCMLINRSLKSHLEARVYGAITDTLQTAVNDELPQEWRWLSIHADLAWPQLPASFRACFAVLGAELGTAQRCVNAAVVAQAMQEGQAAAPGMVPLVLMLDEGRLSLRMQTAAYHLPDVQYALGLFCMLGQVAMHHLPWPPPESQLTTEPPEG